MALDVVLLFDIAVILIVAKVLGEIAERMGVSSMVRGYCRRKIGRAHV